MKLIIEENEQKMSESAMFILLGAMMQDKRVNISLTSGRSPKTMYDMMIPYVKIRLNLKILSIIFLMKTHILMNLMDQTGRICKNYF